MKDIHIGIIGGTGGIGRWFADFFRKEGFTVSVAGRHTEVTPSGIAAQCQVVVVSVPIDVTVDVICEIGPQLKREQLLMDFTSLKEEPMAAMLGLSVAEVVGCHPLFGPDVISLAGENIVLCPGRGERWFNCLKDLLETRKARVVVTTPRVHDDMMAVVQGLTHINTIAFGLALKELNIDRETQDSFSTPVFRAKKKFMEKIFSDHHGLYVDMIMRNPNKYRIVEAYKQVVAEIERMIAAEDSAGLNQRIVDASTIRQHIP